MSACLDLARNAIAMARRLADRDALLHVLTTFGLLSIPYAPPEERLASYMETLHLGLAAGDKLAALRAYLTLTATSWELGDLAGALAHLASHEALCDTFRHDRFRWLSRTLRASLAVWSGDFAEAERLHRELVTRAEEDATRGWVLFAFPVVLARARERDDEDLARLEAKGRQAFASLHHELAVLIGELYITQLYARAGERARVSTLLESLRSHPMFAALTEPAWLVLLAEPCHLLGDAALAARIHRALLPREHHICFLGPVAGQMDLPFQRDLALVCQVMGRRDEAVARAREALATIRTTEQRSQLARVSFELASMLRARGEADDHAEATTLLGAARAQAEALGQTRLVRWIAEREQRQDAHAATVAEAQADVAPAKRPHVSVGDQRERRRGPSAWRDALGRRGRATSPRPSACIASS